MAITATLTVPQIIKQVNLRRVIEDLDAQCYYIQADDGIGARYEPTKAEWDWFINGFISKLQQTPRLSNVTPDQYRPGEHLNPGTWS